MFKKSINCCQSTYFLLVFTAHSFSSSVIKQEIEEQQVPNDFKVNVKLNTTPGEDLVKILEDMRQEYEFLIKKKHRDLDAWYKEQVKEKCPNLPAVPFLCGPMPMSMPVLFAGSHSQQPLPRRRPVQQLCRATKATSMSWSALSRPWRLTCRRSTTGWVWTGTVLSQVIPKEQQK